MQLVINPISIYGSFSLRGFSLNLWRAAIASCPWSMTASWPRRTGSDAAMVWSAATGQRGEQLWLRLEDHPTGGEWVVAMVIQGGAP